MGEGVGQGVGLGRRVILVFFGVWQGKRREGFSFLDLFLEGGFLAGQVFVLVCVKKEAAPLMCVLFGGVGVRQGCTVWLV